MTTNDSFDRRLVAWLDEESRHRVPDHLGEVLVRTVATRQRIGWTSPERWLPMDLTARARSVTPFPLWRAVTLAALLLALAGLAIWFAGSRTQRLPAPFGPAANGAIVSWELGDIYVSSADGTGKRVLVGGDSTDLAPVHTRDGTKFVFLRNVGYDASLLMLANADGSNVRPILDQPLVNPGWYEWSPSDDRLAVIHVRGDRRVLSIVTVGSPGRIQDIPIPDGLAPGFDVQWRPPGGDELILSAWLPNGRSAGLFAVRPDGTGWRQILPATPKDGYYSMTLAPDGRSAAYWIPDPGPESVTTPGHVHFVDLGTGVDRRVVFDPTAKEETDFAYAPDGSSGLVVRHDENVDGVLLVSPDGSVPPRRVGQPFADDIERAVGWSPDGRTVFVHFDGKAPTFIDAATGVEAASFEAMGRMATWQRLAP